MAKKKTVKTKPRASFKKVVKAPVKKAPGRRTRRKFAFQSPKGMHDILPEEAAARGKLYKITKDVLEFYGFARIETPILESEELFVRTVGGDTDIVSKQMYSVRSGRGTKLVLRPELTAPVVRSYLEHSMHRLPQPQKFYYIGPTFRHERPQAGRYRQFWQIGVEILGGESDPVYDAQSIISFCRLLEELKLKDIVVGINSIGSVGDRQNYKKKLIEHYKRYEKDLCRDCKRRMTTNPMRLLDCKGRGCQSVKDEAPLILDYLSGASKSHFKNVLEFLDEVSIPYTLKPHLVRGLDYYNKTVFEIFLDSDEKGASALVAGGRYDYLAESLGGRATAGVGGALGIERVLEVVRERDPAFGQPRGRKKIFLVHIGQLAKRKSISLLEEFRAANIPVVSSLGKSSLSNQLETANKTGAALALILGQKEVFEESIIIRDMKTGIQETVPLNKVIKAIKKKLK